MRIEIPTLEDQMMDQEDEDFAPPPRQPMTWQQIGNWDTLPAKQEWAPPPPAPGWDHIPSRTDQKPQISADRNSNRETTSDTGEAYERKRQRTDSE